MSSWLTKDLLRDGEIYLIVPSFRKLIKLVRLSTLQKIVEIGLDRHLELSIKLLSRFCLLQQGNKEDRNDKASNSAFTLPRVRLF